MASGCALCNRYRNVDNINDYCNMDLTNERICVFSGYDAVVHLLSDTQYIKPAMWDKLYKSSLFETLRFPNTFFEDAAITYKLLYTLDYIRKSGIVIIILYQYV